MLTDTPARFFYGCYPRLNLRRFDIWTINTGHDSDQAALKRYQAEPRL